MAKRVNRRCSPRYGIAYDRVPTRDGYVIVAPGYDYAVPGDYGLMLDALVDMTEMLACSNGLSYEQALGQVIKDEGFTVLPTSRKMILTLLAEAETPGSDTTEPKEENDPPL